jgi:hypothetical protein
MKKRRTGGERGYGEEKERKKEKKRSRGLDFFSRSEPWSVFILWGAAIRMDPPKILISTVYDVCRYSSVRYRTVPRYLGRYCSSCDGHLTPRRRGKDKVTKG